MMQPIVLDTNFNSIKVIDAYNAFIWTERYGKAGDFELHLPANTELLTVFQPTRYLYLSESEKLMIIERVEIQSDSVDGNVMIVSGRSIESILDRRIVWSQTTLDGYLEGQIRKLLNENVISPSDSDRAISNFIFENCNDSYIASITIRSQYTGDNIYDVLVNICEDLGIGFKVYLNDSNQFVFRLTNGVDRSYDQDTNSPVTFSPSFDNLISSDYKYDVISYRTMALVAGAEQGDLRKRTAIILDQSTGLERRELYVDARDITQEEGVTDEEYYELLAQRGKEKMVDYTETRYFDASMETSIAAKYGVDFYLGDIVQVQNEYGLGAKCRVTELIRSMKSSGYYEYPTFELI